MTTPSGFNDNNLFRKNIESNRIFNGYETKKYQNNNNYIEAHSKSNTLLNLRDTRNKGGLIHNNIGSNVLSENIVEYKIHIDSADREVQLYNDPYDFSVKFGDANVTSDGFGNKTYNNPRIPFVLENVKYIRLETIILPKYSGLFKTILDEYIVDPLSLLINDRFVMLDIEELNHEIYTTNNARPFALIIPDSSLGNIYYTGSPWFGTKIYKTSNLGNIKKLSIKLFDSFGKKIVMNGKYDASELSGKLLTDLRHPLNKQFQIYMSFAVGIMGCDVNTKQSYL